LAIDNWQVVAAPFAGKFSQAHWFARVRHGEIVHLSCLSAWLGKHAGGVFTAVGIDAAKLARLRANGIVAPQPFGPPLMPPTDFQFGGLRLKY
jgi:hypothetical protein